MECLPLNVIHTLRRYLRVGILNLSVQNKRCHGIFSLYNDKTEWYRDVERFSLMYLQGYDMNVQDLDKVQENLRDNIRKYHPGYVLLTPTTSMLRRRFKSAFCKKQALGIVKSVYSWCRSDSYDSIVDRRELNANIIHMYRKSLLMLHPRKADLIRDLCNHLHGRGHIMLLKITRQILSEHEFQDPTRIEYAMPSVDCMNMKEGSVVFYKYNVPEWRMTLCEKDLALFRGDPTEEHFTWICRHCLAETSAVAHHCASCDLPYNII